MIDKLRRLPDWFWLLLIASILRLPTLGMENLWYDETFTAYLARLDLQHAWVAIQGDVHPPLWYWISWALVQAFGSSEFVLRLPAALLGIATVILVWRIALLLHFEPRTAFVAGLLACFLPSLLYYSQEARMYSLLVCSLHLAIWAALDRRWIILTLACIILVYSHNMGLFYFLALASVTLLTIPYHDRQWGKAWLAFGLAGSAWALLLPLLLEQTGQVGASYWLPPLTVGGLIWPVFAMTIGTRLADIFQMPCYLIMLIMIVVGLINSRRWLISPAGRTVAAVAFGAPALMILVSLAWRNVYMHRVTLPAMTLLLFPVAYGLMHLNEPNRLLARATFIPALAIGVIAFYFPVAAMGRGSQVNWLAPIRNGYQAGDVLYHLTVDSAIADAYYAHGLDQALFPESNDLAQSLTDKTKAAMQLSMVDFDHLLDRGYRRAWLIVSDSPMMSQLEIDSWQAILAKYPYSLITYEESPYHLADSYIYLVELS